MKISLALPLLVGVVVYLAGSLVFSAYSGERYAEVEAHATKLRKNVEELERIQSALLAEAEMYRRSPDALALAARSLGYVDAGDRVIRVSGSQRAPQTRSPGRIVRRPESPRDPRPYLRAAALIAMLATIAFEVSNRPANDQRTLRASK